MHPTQTRYERPATVEEASALLAQHGDEATVIAGGQWLTLRLRDGAADPAVLVDVSAIPALSGVTASASGGAVNGSGGTDATGNAGDAGDVDGAGNGEDAADGEDAGNVDAAGTVSIGAATTYAELRAHPIADECGELAAAIDVIGDVQVRNVGTLGGALCVADPSYDVVPPLCCLDVRVRIGGPDGRRTTPIGAFLRGDGGVDLRGDELVEAIEFDRPPGVGTYANHRRVAAGGATVGVAARLSVTPDGPDGPDAPDAGRIDDARVALGAVADRAVRAGAVEDALVGAPASRAAIEAAAPAVQDAIDPTSDRRGSEAYKRDLAETYVVRALATCLDATAGTPGEPGSRSGPGGSA